MSPCERCFASRSSLRRSPIIRDSLRASGPGQFTLALVSQMSSMANGFTWARDGQTVHGLVGQEKVNSPPPLLLGSVCLHQLLHRVTKGQRSQRQFPLACEKQESPKAGWSAISKATQLFGDWERRRLFSISGDRRRQADSICCS